MYKVKKLCWGIILCVLLLSLGYNGFYAVFSSLNRNYFYSRRTSRIPMDEKLMDLNDFEFIRNNEDICNSVEIQSEDSLILILVHSARKNIESRKAIRETWGSVREYGRWKYRTIFLLGLPTIPPPVNNSEFSALYPSESIENDQMKLDLQTEIETYGDIIIGNFIDTYRNMTYKHLMGYKYVRHFCPWATAVLRTDDDMFIDIFELTDFLVKNRNDTSSMFCVLMKERRPERGQFDKWAVSRDEYKYDVYPDYCLGAAYVTRPNLIEKLYRVSGDFKYFWIDDVLVTGMMRTYPNMTTPRVEITDIRNKFVIYNHHTEKQWKKEWMFVLVSRNLVPPVLERLWNRSLRTGNYSSASPHLAL